MKKWFEFWTRHLYMVLLILSCTAVSVTGAFVLPYCNETYTEIPALAGAAIHEMKNMLADQEEEGAFFEVSSKETDPEEESLKDTSSSEKEENSYEEKEEKEEKEGKETSSAKKKDTSSSDKEESASPEKKSSSKKKKKSSSKKKKSSSSKKKKSSSSKKKKSSSSKKKKSSSERKEDYLNPDWKLVDEDYFGDACFIGDSRELGFGMYSQLDNITVYAEKGIQIYKAATKAFISTPEGKITIAQALEQNQGRFGKVYIMFGLNEMGWGDDETLDEYYYNLIDYIKQTQPDAVIYLQSIIHVTSAKAASNPVFSNESIDERNEHLKEIAKKEHIYYLDLNEIFTDENNGLIADSTTDGVHLKSQYILLWKEYLMAHAIVRN